MHKGSVFSFIRKLASCESLWLILLKILVINRVQGKQVVELIKNENIDWGTQKFRWWGAGSISQERLEKAIQLPASALTNSFIENVVGRRVGSKQAIRHWELCIAMGYHSSLFFLEEITHCPWHGKQLLACRSCYFALDYLDRSSVHTRDFLLGNHCDHVKAIIERMPVCDLSNPVFNFVERWHEFFLDWLKAAKDRCGNDLYRWLGLTGYYSSKDTDYILRFLEPKIDVPTGFDIITDYPVSRLNIPHAATAWCQKDEPLVKGWQSIRQEKIRDMGMQCSFKTDQIACVKSICRYVRRRYLARHRRCFKSFASLKANHRMGLEYEHTCCVSVAYACWLVNIHDVRTVDSALKKKARAYRIPRSEPVYPRPISLLAKDLNLLLAQFYEIWAGLVVSEQSNETIVVLESVRLHPWASANIASIDNIVTQDECFGSSDYGLYYPAPTYLSEMTELRCKRNCLKENYASPDLIADQGEYFFSEQGRLCVLTDRRWRLGSYRYLRI
jgi:hypothetical protein